jgi:ABC-type lipoprotein export system ATPase subunit
LPDTILDATDLTKHYAMGANVVRALDGVTLTVAEGEFVGLLGTSGSGKSTLLNLIAGLDRASSGRLLVFGQDLTSMSSDDLSRHRQKNVGIIFQSFNLISTMSATENVALSMMFAGVPRAENGASAGRLISAPTSTSRSRAAKPATCSRCRCGWSPARSDFRGWSACWLAATRPAARPGSIPFRRFDTTDRWSSQPLSCEGGHLG